MRFFFVFLVGIVPIAAQAQYQPIGRFTPPQNPVATIQPLPQAPIQAAPGSPENQQMVPEPDAPDEDEGMPKAAPPGMEPLTSGPSSPAAMAAPEVSAQTKPAINPGETDFTSVQLRGLNKVTARAETIEAPIGSSVRFGTIEIVAHRCWQSSPEDRPENAALLEISEVRQGEPPTRIFLGWMYSSSPALSALQHPFYDITVIACAKAEEKDIKDASHASAVKKP